MGNTSQSGIRRKITGLGGTDRTSNGPRPAPVARSAFGRCGGITGFFFLALCLPSCREPRNELPIQHTELAPEQLRLLLAQVVDDPQAPEECGILEGKAYKYLLKKAARIRENKLDNLEDKQVTYERLLKQPNLFRGHVVVVRRAAVIEVEQAALGPEYELPGYSVLPALLVDSAHDLYELRILSPPGSGMFEKLKQGIAKGENPVLRVSGFFLKNHMKLTNKRNEPPWRAPLLVAPEPSIERRVGTHNAMQDLAEAKMDHYLPSTPIRGPKAEERLVVEALPSTGRPAALRLAIDGVEISGDLAAKISAALSALRARLPPPQEEHPSAVILRARSAAPEGVREARRLLDAASVKRLFEKDENEILLEAPRKKK